MIAFHFLLLLFALMFTFYEYKLYKRNKDNDTAIRNFNLMLLFGTLCIIIIVYIIFNDFDSFLSINLNDVLNEGNSMQQYAFTTGHDNGLTEVAPGVNTTTIYTTIPVALVLHIRACRLQEFFMNRANPLPKKIVMCRTVRLKSLPYTEINLS